MINPLVKKKAEEGRFVIKSSPKRQMSKEVAMQYLDQRLKAKVRAGQMTAEGAADLRKTLLKANAGTIVQAANAVRVEIPEGPRKKAAKARRRIR